jgi:hypothetical protein
MITHHKRVVDGELKQILIIKKNGIFEDYNWCAVAEQYTGEELKEDEMVEISLDEFRDIACEHNLLNTDVISVSSDARNLVSIVPGIPHSLDSLSAHGYL